MYWNQISIIFLICHKYETIEFEKSLNSFEIKKSIMDENVLQVFNVNELKIDTSFERKFALNSIFVIAENLEIFKEIK